MCSRQRMKRYNEHTLYLGYVRTSGENALKKKNKTLRYGEKRPRTITHAYIVNCVALHLSHFICRISFIGHRTQVQHTECDGIWFEQDRKERRQRATRKPHTYSACLGAYFPTLWGPHKKCLYHFSASHSKSVFTNRNVYSQEKKKIAEHMSTILLQLVSCYDEKSCGCKRKKNLAFYNGAVKEVYIHLCHTHINISKYNTARTKSGLLGPKQRLV